MSDHKSKGYHSKSEMKRMEMHKAEKSPHTATGEGLENNIHLAAFHYAHIRPQNEDGINEYTDLMKTTMYESFAAGAKWSRDNDAKPVSLTAEDERVKPYSAHVIEKDGAKYWEIVSVANGKVHYAPVSSKQGGSDE